MGAEGMAQSVRFNLQQKGDWKTIYDRKDTRRSGVYEVLDDHRTLNSHSFALFQKEQFAKRKKERKKRIRLRFLVCLITFVVILIFLFVWRNADLSVLKVPLYQ